MGDVHDRRVDIHLIAATHLDLAVAVREKRFRSDLYFRINTIPLAIPPLRERPEDIPLLARHLLKRLSTDVARGAFKLSTQAETALRQHPWPGNIRELRNVLERAILLSDQSVLLPRHLRFDSQSPHDPVATDTSLTLIEMEQRYIERILAEEKGHVDQAARRLGVPRSSLYQKIKKYGIRES